MPDTTTPNFGLTLPTVGADRDTWGTLCNSNFSTIDTFLGYAMPIGALLDHAGANAPPGWLVADGRAISRTTYSQLFTAIGTNWGPGDGSTTFNLPNLIGRAGVGPGTMTDAGGISTTFVYATTAGYVSQHITQANLPAYNLVTDVQGWHSHTGATAGGGGHQHTTDAQGSHSHGGATSTDSVNHTHSGTTDTQGIHNHSVNAFGAVGGPNAIAPGGIATGQAIYTSSDGGHAHNFTTGGISNAHTHSIVVDGNHAHTTTYIGDHSHPIYPDGNHQHNVNLNGGGVAMTIQSPVAVVTKIIYAGQQAAALVTGAMAPVTSAATSDIEELREEIAQLRSLLLSGVPPRRRVVSSPLRGIH
jgi:microcystin-dependent protein